MPDENRWVERGPERRRQNGRRLVPDRRSPGPRYVYEQRQFRDRRRGERRRSN